LSICKHSRHLAVLCCAFFALLAPGAASSASSHPLATAVEQPDASLTDLRDAYTRIKASGANYVRIILYWDIAQPTRTTYDWTEADKQVDNAVSAGLTPFVTVWRAPAWAERRGAAPFNGERGTVNPDPVAFGDFGRRLALHFPQVHNWEAWNEPNLDHFLSPQVADHKRYSPGLYRDLLNQFWAGVHSVDPTATVAAGGLARRFKIPPLEFMRKVFCLAADTLKPVQSCPVHLDAWSHHPYTNGGPFTKEGDPDGVSLGDLPRMRRTLNAAAASGNALPAKSSIPFWISEFSWDTDGPDPDAVPMRLHARWVSEALYQAWRSGVSLFVWHQLRDRPFPATQYQSGLYFCGRASTSDDVNSRCAQSGFYARDKAKSGSLLSFRLPFVAYAKNGHVKVWGRTADSAAHRVVIERKVSGNWRSVKALRANGYGIYSARWRSSDRSHIYRAHIRSGAHSNGFSLRKSRSISLPNTWGCGGSIPC
jgi:polysaccharide biosynthesis protein PslG